MSESARAGDLSQIGWIQSTACSESEIQYHLHTTLEFTNAAGETESWDSAINLGTNDSDDLLQYKLIFDYEHALLDQVQPSPGGFTDLNGKEALPALDYLRSDILAATGPWRDIDIIDGSDQVEPVASLLRLLRKAMAISATGVYFGRKYIDGDGIHDVHMNQGSTGSFLNNGADDHNDHNDIWQDGALIVDLGEPQLAAYFPPLRNKWCPPMRSAIPKGKATPLPSPTIPVSSRDSIANRAALDFSKRKSPVNRSSPKTYGT